MSPYPFLYMLKCNHRLQSVPVYQETYYKLTGNKNINFLQLTLKKRKYLIYFLVLDIISKSLKIKTKKKSYFYYGN